MSPEQALSQLRHIHLPPTAVAEPLIPMWLLPMIAMIIAGLGCLWWRNRRRQIWLVQTRQILRSITNDALGGEAERGWQRLAVLMRQLMLVHGEPGRVASLTGDAWLSELDQTFQTDLFLHGPGRRITDMPYQPHCARVKGQQLAALCAELLPVIERLAQHINESAPVDSDSSRAEAQ